MGVLHMRKSYFDW